MKITKIVCAVAAASLSFGGIAFAQGDSPNIERPPDTILREVHERSGDKPFARIEDVVSREELAKIAESYKQAAGLRLGGADPAGAGA